MAARPPGRRDLASLRAGLWFGVFPTWEGFAAQVGAALFVLGSYAGAEWLRGRRRRKKLEPRDVDLPARDEPAPDPAVPDSDGTPGRTRIPVGAGGR